MTKLRASQISAAGLADGTYALSVQSGKVTGLTLAPTGGGGGSSTPATLDAALAELGTAVVHRWKCDEASGATIADSVGGLNLTLSGTYTRGVTTPLGNGINFASGSQAISSGIGNIPVGNAPRCLIVVYRLPGVTDSIPFLYGTSTTRGRIAPTFNRSTNALSISCFGDDLTVSNTFAPPVGGGTFHMLAANYDGARGLIAYLDGMVYGKTYTADLATASTPFTLGQASAEPFIGDIAQMIVINKALSKRALDRIFNSMPL